MFTPLQQGLLFGFGRNRQDFCRIEAANVHHGFLRSIATDADYEDRRQDQDSHHHGRRDWAWQGTELGLAKAGHTVIATVESWPQVTQLRKDSADFGVTLTIEKLEYTNDADHDTLLRKYGETADIVLLNAAIGETGPAAEIPLERY